eukprot:15470051-Alexandrium_andersonii.AAC.1
MDECVSAILGAAVVSGCETVVLGAIGRGADGHPPEEVAGAFRRALLESEWRSAGLREILFCILEDHNAFRTRNPDGNGAAFADALHWADPEGLDEFQVAVVEARDAA